LGLALFLQSMDNGQYFLEYCDRMSKILDQQNRELVSQLQTLGANYENLVTSAPQASNAPFTPISKSVSI
jgi:hypothetical protein